MTLIKSIIKQAVAVAAVAAVGSSLASAQNTESAYFTDGYLYRYQMNPAIANDANFVAIPGVGNVNVELGGSLNLKNILYNVNGRTSLFLNPNVSAAEVLNNLNDKNRVGVDAKIGILSAGFKAFGGYNTISINARTSVGVSVPRELFSLLKEGVENKTYDISNLGARATAWAEIGFGHSRQINNQWRVGGTLKLLIGAADFDADLREAQLELAENEWKITADGELNSSMKGLTYKSKTNTRTGRTYVDGIDVDGAGIGGFGVAVDLGAEYRINEDWNVGVSVTDLGFISWNNNWVGSTNGVQTVNTDDYSFNVDGDASNSFSSEWHNLRDKLSNIYQLSNLGDQGSRTTMLGATTYVAVDYTLPVCRQLKFGLINSTRIQGDYSWTNFRLSANATASKALSAGVSVAYGTFGTSFGYILNIHPRGFNVFVATDHSPKKFAKQGVPLTSNATVNFGLNIPF
jgi:hypothetical protein